MNKNYYLCARFQTSMKHILPYISILLFCVFSFTMRAEEYSIRCYDDSDGLSHWHIAQITQDTTGIIWVATWNGLNRFDGHHFVHFKPSTVSSLDIPNDRIRRMMLTEDNNLLCQIDERLYLFDTRTCCFDTLSETLEKSVPEKMKQHFNPDFDRVKAAKQKQFGSTILDNIWEKEFVDRQGNRWLYDDRSIYVVTPLPSRGQKVNDKEIRCMARMQNGDIWTSVRDEKEVMVYDSMLHLRGYLDSLGRLHKEPVSFGEMVYCIYESSNGDVYMGCKPGHVLRLSTTGEKHIFPDIRNAYDIQQDQDGYIWVATFGFGLWKDFQLVPGTEGMKIRRLLFIEDGVTVAAATSGVMVIDGGKIRLYQRKAGDAHSLSSNAIMCLCWFNGHLYAGTEGGGLNRLENDIRDKEWSWRHWMTADGMESDIVFELLPWSANELLIQGSSSFSLFNVEKGEFTNYGRSFFGGDDNHKLVLGEVPPLALHDNAVLVAPTSGMMVLDKQKIHEDETPIRIALCAIRRNGQEDYAVDNTNHITLSPSERNLVMSFAALDYRNDGKMLYSTRLYSANKPSAPWGAPTSMSEVIIQDVQPGEYIFEIRSTNAYGHWQDNTRRIHITVQPTFMESTIGKALLSGLVLLIVLVITIAYLQVRYSHQKRAETLSAFLELQERLSELEKDKAHSPLPIPEIIAPGYTSENERFLNTLHRFMDEHISDSEMNMDDLAKEVNMSRSTLNRKMHELFNLSAKDFVQAARIKHACGLLATTQMAMKEVAYACGFSDPNYFSKSFKTNTGQTPKEYREKCNN